MAGTTQERTTAALHASREDLRGNAHSHVLTSAEKYHSRVRASGGPRLGRVYPIIGTDDSAETLRWARAFLQAGVSCIQIREKRMGDPDLLGLIREIVSLRDASQAVIVNDRADLALDAKADGAHLGQDDMPADEARRLLGPRAVIGLSTHDEEQFRLAQQAPVDYVAIGPIFASPTKPGAHAEVGLERLRRMASRSRRPVVAIGGITLARAAEVWDAGADSVAVISDLLGHSDPVGRLGQYLEAGEEFDR